MCRCVHLSVCVCPVGICMWNRGVGGPGAGVTYACEPRVLGVNLGPLEEQPVLLTTEPSLQSFPVSVMLKDSLFPTFL